MRLVINRCFGGFGLSDAARARMAALGHPDAQTYSLRLGIDDRSHPALVQAVEELGKAADGRYARLEVVDVPDDAVNPYIIEFDGSEYVCEGRAWPERP